MRHGSSRRWTALQRDVGRFAPAAIIGYWTIVLVEPAAGTPLGDWLDSRHGLGLGLPIASAITTALLVAGAGMAAQGASARR